LSDLADVFLEKTALATMDPATLVYRVDTYTPVPEGTDGGLFFGATFIEPGLVGAEYFMTRGHFHSRIQAGEYYWGVQGEGVLVLMDEARHCRAERMKPGSLHYIPGRTAHRVANIGTQTLCFGACWPADAGHDYQTIAEHGFSARVMKAADGPRIVSADGTGAPA
jgi:glucose-6-phosphate isomerase